MTTRVAAMKYRVTESSPLPKSKAEIMAKLAADGDAFEPFEQSVPTPGVSAYKLRGISAGMAFTEHDGVLREVEAIGTAELSRRYTNKISFFATTIGEVSTGFPYDELRTVIEQTMADVGTTPQGIHRFVDDRKHKVKVDVRRQSDGGWSFRFAGAVRQAKPVSA